MTDKRTRDDEFAANFARAREAQGMSRDEVAEALEALGYSMHPSTVGKIERGDRRVSIGEAEALATVVERTLDQLLGGAWRTELLHQMQLVQDAAAAARSGVRDFRRLQHRLAQNADFCQQQLAEDPELSQRIRAWLLMDADTFGAEADEAEVLSLRPDELRDFTPDSDPFMYLLFVRIAETLVGGSDG